MKTMEKKPLREFVVTMPFSGIAVRTVHAETEEEAIEIALNDSTFPVGSPDDKYDVDILEIELHRHIVQGNVFYGRSNQIEVEDYGEVDEINS